MLDSTADLSPQAAGATVAPPGSKRSLPPAAQSLGRVYPKLLEVLAPVALLGLVVPGVMLVALTAAHPNFMVPTSNSLYFPAWMAGPLRGLWPGRPLGEHAVHTWVTVFLTTMYMSYVTVVALSGKLRVHWVIGAILAIHLAFLLAPPLQYTDVFNYVNYGRMGVVHHLNPYTTMPMLEPQNDATFTLSNWHWLVSPYGPIFTLLTYLLVPLGVAGAFWAFKVILCLASLSVLALVWRSAQILGRDPTRALLLVGLNPIVLVWGIGADHNDVLMVLPLVLGVYLLIRARSGAPNPHLPLLRARVVGECLAAGALIVAAGVKASAAVVIPIAFAVAPGRRALVAGFAIALVTLGLASLVAFGLHLPGVGAQTQLVTGIGPANLLGWALGQGGETDTLRAVLTVLAGAFVLLAAVSASRPGRDWIALAGASLFVVWITTSWFAPWYIVWILPFAALAERRRLTVCLLTVGVYILLAFGPEVTPLLKAVHFNPFGSPIGIEHYRENSHLVQ
jgi:hypothetical protein